MWLVVLVVIFLVAKILLYFVTTGFEDIGTNYSESLEASLEPIKKLIID